MGDTIIIYSQEPPETESAQARRQQDLGGGDVLRRVVSKLYEHEIPIQDLQDSIQQFFTQMTGALAGSRQVETEGFQLEQIEFTLQIGAKGKVGLIAAGVEGSAQGGIKFVLKRKD